MNVAIRIIVGYAIRRLGLIAEYGLGSSAMYATILCAFVSSDWPTTR